MIKRLALAFVLVACCALTPQQRRRVIISSVSLPRPLVHYYCEDNAASTVVVNRGTIGANGVSTRNTNVFSTASGKIGRGFDFFAGGSVDLIDVGSEPIADYQGFTFTAWIKPDSAGGSSIGRVFAAADGVPAVWLIADGKISYNSINTLATIWTAGVWTHLGIVRNGGTVSVFKDGVYVETLSGVNQGGVGRYVGNRSDGIRWFDGVMDDIRIYDRVLSQEAISVIYNGGLGTLN